VSHGATIGRELPACGQGHKVEYGSIPSTVRVDSSTLVAAFRSGSTPAKGHQTDRIDITSGFGIHKTFGGFRIPSNGRAE
jgi:hypothetical protein